MEHEFVVLGLNTPSDTICMLKAASELTPFEASKIYPISIVFGDYTPDTEIEREIYNKLREKTLYYWLQEISWDQAVAITQMFTVCPPEIPMKIEYFPGEFLDYAEFTQAWNEAHPEEPKI